MSRLAIVFRLLLSVSLVLNGLAAATMFDVRGSAPVGEASVAAAAVSASKSHCHETPAPAPAPAVAYEAATQHPSGCHPGMGCACDCAHLVAPAMAVLLLPHPVIDAAPMPTLRPVGHRSAIHSPLIRPPIV